MILSRLMKAVREQNWFAVGLEFIIVILGVVIGFQVTAWNESRARDQRAALMMTQLAADLEAERWRIAATTAHYDGVTDEAQLVLDAVSGRLDLPDHALVIKAFRGTQYFWACVIRSTYDELVASGEIALIPQGTFRDAAIEYYNSSPRSLLTEPRRTPFRDAMRQRISPELHAALVENCAENPNIGIGDFSALQNFIDFPCEVDGFDEEITSLATLLRQDEHLIGLLRWRIIESQQDMTNLIYFRALLDRARLASPAVATQ